MGYQEDPLHDGTISSYVIRFILAAFMGLCIEILVGTMVFVSLPHGGEDKVISLCLMAFAFPILTGIYGIFKFDSLKEIFEYVKDRYSNR